MSLLDKMERKMGRYAIKNLSKWLILTYVIGYLITLLKSEILAYIYFEPYMVIEHLQIWRIFTWIFIPPSSSNIFIVLIMLFFYYSIGTSLERTWGAFKYNVYIFSGMIFTIIGGFVLYFVIGQPVLLGGLFSTYYINLSIFLAFAALYPDMQVLLYFFIPIKIKWLAYLDVIVLAYSFIRSNWVDRVAIIVSLLNFIIFFFSLRKSRHISPAQAKRQREFKKAASGGGNHQGFTVVNNTGSITKHKCAICGKTENDGDDLEFRFCSKCNGNYEYCQDHLFTHKHVE